MRSTEGEGQFGKKPIVPDPPEWFNRGRTHAIRREAAQPREVPPVRPPIFEQPASWFQTIRVSGLRSRPQAARGVCPPASHGEVCGSCPPGRPSGFSEASRSARRQRRLDRGCRDSGTPDRVRRRFPGESSA